ncbi:MAG: dual specificity protein phosphatase [Motiliproteus sp.]
MEEVFKNIFVGSKKDAADRAALKKNKIESIFSFEFVITPAFVKAKYFVAAPDRQPVDGPWLGDAFGFLRAQTAMGRNVLVHCQEGISRSPSLVAGYLCFTYGIPIHEAVSLITAKRPQACPNPIFLESIEKFVRAENERVMGA